MTSDQPLSTRKEDDMTPRLEVQRLEATQKLRENAQRNSGTVISEKRWAELLAQCEELDYSELKERRNELEEILSDSHAADFSKLRRDEGPDGYWRITPLDDGEYGVFQMLGTASALLDDRYDPTPAYTKYPEPNGRPGSW